MRKHRANLAVVSLSSLLLIITASLLLVTSESRTYQGDLQVLKDLKNGVHPRSITPGSCLSSWDFSIDPCDHIFSQHFTCGFRCDLFVHNSSRVTEITLDPAGYTGSLNSTTWNLPLLQNLDLSDNSFHGSIDLLSNLTRLRRLALSSNSFSGKLPYSLGSLTHLEELYLDNNRFQGHIPPTLNNLLRLRRLDLQQNHLSGELPSLSSLRTLYFLDASDNELTGRLPPSLPPSLIEISIRNNNMEGNLPDDTMGNLEFLQVLDFSYNKLSGTIFSLLFDHPSLQQLTLSHNNFTFLQQPNNMGFTSKIIALDLSYNKLRGFLPSFMAAMPNLSSLSLENNMFTGMIPSEFALKAVVHGRTDGTSSLQKLLLGGNYLFGPIPGPLMGLKPGSANVSLVDNCLYRCPDRFFFCQGGDQKSLVDCKKFGL